MKFVLFSISAGLIQVVSFTLMEEVLHLPHWVSHLVAPVLSVLTGASVGWNEYLVLTMLVNFVTEYLFDRIVVFGKSLDTAKKQP